MATKQEIQVSIKRLMMSGALWNRWQNLKQDWYGNKVHPLEVWQKLADDYRVLGGEAAVEEVMEDYKKYSKVCQPVSAEKMAEVKDDN